jgi:hypothetical protein
VNVVVAVVAAAAAAAAAAVAATATRKSGYSAFAFASGSPVVQVCDDDVDADTVLASSMPANSPSVHREGHMGENAPPSPQPAIERISHLKNYRSCPAATYRLAFSNKALLCFISCRDESRDIERSFGKSFRSLQLHSRDSDFERKRKSERKKNFLTLDSVHKYNS